MLQTKRFCWETNSSSLHSVAIADKDRYSKLNVTDNIVIAECGDYGWGYEELRTPMEKLSYILTSIRYYDSGYIENINELKESKYFKWLQEMIKDYLGYELEIEYDDIGYVDHQSTDTLDEYWSKDEYKFQENIKELIFNDRYTIIIDNDNH